MQLNCPNCAASYDVPDNAIGPNGRKIRCRACETSWHEPAPIAPSLAPAGLAAPSAVPAAVPAPVPVPAIDPSARTDPAPSEPHAPRPRGPWLLLALVVAVIGLGIAVAVIAFGPQQVASRFGLAQNRVPLGIAITRQPDWRQIAGGSQLFAVSGRIWNPTHEEQPVPDIRVELKDRSGRRVYSWTITRPVARLAANAEASFDGAAVDVPPASANVSVSFAGTDGN